MKLSTKYQLAALFLTLVVSVPWAYMVFAATKGLPQFVPVAIVFVSSWYFSRFFRRAAEDALADCEYASTNDIPAMRAKMNKIRRAGIQSSDRPSPQGPPPAMPNL